MRRTFASLRNGGILVIIRDMIETLNEFPSLKEFVVAPVAFFVIAGVLSTIWAFVRRHWAAVAAKTIVEWDDAVLKQSAAPVRLLIFVLSVVGALQFIPTEIRNLPIIVRTMQAAFIAASLWLVSRLFIVFLRYWKPIRELNPSSRDILLLAIRAILLALMLLMILDTFGISITPILASLGVGSVAVALALQDTLSNFFSGVYILLDKPVRVGDFVSLDADVQGTIQRIGWRSTHMLLLSNNTVVIPNSKLSSARLTNYSMPVEETAVLVQVGVAYGSDLEKVERVTVDVAREILKSTPGSVSSFDPFIRYHTFGNSSVDFTVILRAQKYVDHFLIKHAFVKLLHERYMQEKIEIPFPQRVVHFVGGEKARTL